MVTFRLQRPARLLAGVLAAALSCPAARAAPAAPPDLVFLDGKIVTLDSKGTIASAAAVKNGRFIAVGPDDAIRRLVGPRTRVVKLKGKTVIPGIIDSHCHPVPTMLFTTSVDARAPGVPSVAKAMENLVLRVRTSPRGDWIFVIAASASQTKFAEKRLPTRTELDLAAPDNPVWFWNGTTARCSTHRRWPSWASRRPTPAFRAVAG